MASILSGPSRLEEEEPITSDFKEDAREIEAKKGAGELPPMSVDDFVEEAGFGRFQMQLLFCTGICWAVDSMEIMVHSLH